MQDTDVVKFGLVKALEPRKEVEGPVFWMDERVLVVCDAESAHRIDASNYADLTMQDAFSDVVVGRSSAKVDWKQLRAAWTHQLKSISAGDGLRRLAQRMDDQFERRIGVAQDLTWLAECVTVNSLIPTIVDGLSPAALKRVEREVQSKVNWVLSDVVPGGHIRWQLFKMSIKQLIAGWIVRQEIKGRASGRRPRRDDLTDSLIDLLPTLGVDRAVDAVTSLLTAITGSPGAAAACLLFELHRRPDWRLRLETELRAVSEAELFDAPMRAAPETGRFIKEILRLWSSPPVVSRPARQDAEVAGKPLKAGQLYFLSSYFLHHDARDWPDAEVFDPDRWLTGNARAPCPHAAYVPFGWAPKSCIGASLGMAQLFILAHRVCTRYRVEVVTTPPPRMAIASVTRPIDFHGVLLKQ